MPMINAIRMINNLTAGTMTAAQLQTALATAETYGEWQQLMQFRGSVRQLFASTEAATAVANSALSTPSAATGTGSATGGTLAAATYYVKIVAVDIAGNTTNAGAESTGVTTTGSTSSIAYTWPAVSGAVSYQIWYGTTSGTEANYYTSATNSFTLTAASGTAGTLPTVNNASTAMTAVAASSTAMTAVAASSTAMTAVAASSTAMTAVAASSTAMNAVIASATARSAIYNSDTALNAISASATAITTITGNAAYQTLVNQNSTTTATAIGFTGNAIIVKLSQSWSNSSGTNMVIGNLRSGTAISGTENNSVSYNATAGVPENTWVLPAQSTAVQSNTAGSIGSTLNIGYIYV
ncbi:MAG: hypothetical protein KGI47_10080 [Betaproteobacteria bacterium]|nr:hypothetical protein [Betaproteobacteria bacterium]